MIDPKDDTQNGAFLTLKRKPIKVIHVGLCFFFMGGMIFFYWQNQQHVQMLALMSQKQQTNNETANKIGSIRILPDPNTPTPLTRDQDGWIRDSSPNNTFSFYLPEWWKLSDSGDDWVSYISPSGNKIHIYRIINNDLTLTQFLSTQDKNLNQIGREGVIIKSSKQIVIFGKKAIQRVEYLVSDKVQTQATYIEDKNHIFLVKLTPPSSRELDSDKSTYDNLLTKISSSINE